MSGAGGPHRFVLIRHAEAMCNVLPDDARMTHYDTRSPLTPRGIRQARALARRMPAGLRSDPLFCSPLRRARETAAPIARRQEITVSYDDRLVETIASAPFSPPLSQEAWDALLARRITYPDAVVAPGVEPFAAQDARIRAFLAERHAIRGDARCTLIVSHALTIELAILALLGLDRAALASFRLRLSNAAVHVVENDALGGQARLMLVNARHHLGHWP